MTAARIDISEREFWGMLPREFMRRAEVFRERQNEQSEIEKHRHYSRMNAVGLAFHGKDWKWLDPDEPAVPDDLEERWDRVYAKHLRKLEKKRQEAAKA